MIQTFVIPMRFLGRNESEKLSRSHWSKANEVKHDETEAAMLYAKKAGIKPYDGPVDVLVVFDEQVRFFKNGKRKKSRDADNVQSAVKPIIDGLVKAGVITDDCPEVVRRVIPAVLYTTDEPKVTVVIDNYKAVRKVTFPPVELPDGR